VPQESTEVVRYVQGPRPFIADQGERQLLGIHARRAAVELTEYSEVIRSGPAVHCRNLVLPQLVAEEGRCRADVNVEREIDRPLRVVGNPDEIRLAECACAARELRTCAREPVSIASAVASSRVARIVSTYSAPAYSMFSNVDDWIRRKKGRRPSFLRSSSFFSSSAMYRRIQCG
jgi:hypothetical protein